MDGLVVLATIGVLISSMVSDTTRTEHISVETSGHAKWESYLPLPTASVTKSMEFSDQTSVSQSITKLAPRQGNPNRVPPAHWLSTDSRGKEHVIFNQSTDIPDWNIEYNSTRVPIVSTTITSTSSDVYNFITTNVTVVTTLQTFTLLATTYYTLTATSEVFPAKFIGVGFNTWAYFQNSGCNYKPVDLPFDITDMRLDSSWSCPGYYDEFTTSGDFWRCADPEVANFEWVTACHELREDVFALYGPSGHTEPWYARIRVEGTVILLTYINNSNSRSYEVCIQETLYDDRFKTHSLKGYRCAIATINIPNNRILYRSDPPIPGTMEEGKAIGRFANDYGMAIMVMGGVFTFVMALVL
jgi:hypothetical protein